MTYTPKTQAMSSVWDYIHTLTIIDNGDNEDLNIKRKEEIFPILLNISLILPKDYQYIYNYNLYKLYSVDFKKSMELFRWSVDFHNLVNKTLNKQEISYEDALSMYCNAV